MTITEEKSMFNLPCGCVGSLRPLGFSRECPQARALFERLRSDPSASAPDNPTSAELRKHVTDQL